jgi:hypothetical protein
MEMVISGIIKIRKLQVSGLVIKEDNFTFRGFF